MSSSRLSAQENTILALPLNQHKIDIDGKLDELIWQKAPSTGPFTQKEPYEGTPASNLVETRFIYSNDYLYIGAKMYRNSKDVQHIISRRDNSASSERIIFSLDTYLDRITSYSFGVTASGVRLDYFHPTDNPYSRDYSWNPVWEAQAYIGEDFWSVEIKIPFSQLRFNDADELVFGLNINHYVPNTNEDAFWIHIPRKEVGWASHFGYLNGIKGVKSSARVEILPYYATDLTHQNTVDSENPFDAAYSWQNRIGADIKLGLGTNLTLDAAINPDFGQVEADPAFVNLSQFEVIQSERRPFFTEGSSLFSGGGSGYFYSRRIGANPRLNPDVDYKSANNSTTILAAGKVTGRLPSGLSVGVLSSITGDEYVNTFTVNSSEYKRIKVEPLSSYNVIRLQQEFGDYGSKTGIILTGVKRSIDPNSDINDILNKQALTGAADWNIRFNKRMYELNGNIGFSYVEGSPKAILRLQESSARNYQRPDANHVSIDSTLTTLSGYTAELEVAKKEGSFLWSVRGEAESPGFELNDIGVVQSVDEYNFLTGIAWRDLTPNAFYNRIQLESEFYSVWNYGHIRNGSWLTSSFEYLFPNFARISLTHEFGFGGLSDDITRGGPLMERPQGHYFNFSTNTNQGLANLAGTTFTYFINGENSSNWSFAPYINGQYAGRFEYRITPSLSHKQDNRQYITTISRQDSRTFYNRYVFSTVEQSTFALRIRVNYSITPDMSLEVYTEPFISSAKFSRFGELSKERTNTIRYFGEDGTSINLQNDEYLVTDGNESFTLDDPDFKVFSFRSNIVFRYEWIPGSTLFLVWQQNKYNRLNNYGRLHSGDLFETFQSSGSQVFAFKVSYWFSGARLFN